MARQDRRDKKAPDAIDAHLGSQMRLRRNALQMTQQQLGNALGLTFQQVQKYEEGINRVGASRLQQIASILQVPIEFFFEEAFDIAAPQANASSPAYVNGFVASFEGRRLAKAFMRIGSRRMRRAIVGLVQELFAADR
jgi:transcriptional regulator with XRE-family HTH domain